VLCEATVRIPFESDLPPLSWLKRGIRELQSYYAGSGAFFDITLTANLVLKSGRTGDLDIWYGHSFGGAEKGGDLSVGEAFLVRNAKEVDEKVPAEVNLEAFAGAIRRRLPDSDVSVDSVVNLIYIIRTFDRTAEAPARAQKVHSRKWKTSS
jgi:hypothetical protein